MRFLKSLECGRFRHEEENMSKQPTTILPVLPLKNTILFPGLLLPLSVGRPSSLEAVETALKSESREIILVAQRDPNAEAPGQDGLHTIGTKAVIRQVSRNGNAGMEILVARRGSCCGCQTGADRAIPPG